MEYKKIKSNKLFYTLGIIAFGLVAMASSGTKELISDPDFQEGFRQGFNSVYSQVEENEVDTITIIESSDFAFNDNNQIIDNLK